MNIERLNESLQAGRRPVITFKAAIVDKEEYAEPNMRARLIGMTPADADGVAKLRFDFEEFASHNAQFEVSTYFDKGGLPTLTARQAGFYREQDDIYFDADEDLGRFLELVPDAAAALHDRFKAQAPDCTYIAWLESQVLAQLA